MNDLQLITLMTAIIQSRSSGPVSLAENFNNSMELAERIMEEGITRQNTHALKHREEPQSDTCFHCRMQKQIDAMKKSPAGLIRPS